MLTERLPPFADVFLGELPRRAGREPVEGVLQEVAGAALAFYGESFPMSVSVFSEPGLLSRHREEMKRRGAGPQKANEALAAYLGAERDLGRVRGDADPEPVPAGGEAGGDGVTGHQSRYPRPGGGGQGASPRRGLIIPACCSTR